MTSVNSSPPMTFSQKEVRKFRKKARHAEERYKETNDDKYLRERDAWNDKVDNIIRNMETDRKMKVKKEQEESKSDDQLLNEAMRQNRRERNDAEQKVRVEEKKKEEMKKRRTELKKQIEEKKKNMEEMKEKYNEMVEKANNEEEVAKKEFIHEYRERFPDSNASQVQKEFVKHKAAIVKGENLKTFYVKTMSDITGEEVDVVVKDYDTVHENFRKANESLLEKDFIEKFEEECKALLTEVNCKKSFVNAVVKMTGEQKEQVEKEYDENYEKYKEYAKEKSFTRMVSINRYVELCEKKLEAAHFRYMVVNNIMKEKNVDVDEANVEFDKMMNVMSKDEPEDPLCPVCD